MPCYALPAPLASRDLQAAFVLQSDLRAAEGGDMTTRGSTVPISNETAEGRHIAAIRPEGGGSCQFGTAGNRHTVHAQPLTAAGPCLAALLSRVICEFCHLDSRSQNDRVGSCGQVGQSCVC
jgi:hypothetical protein